MASGAAGVLIVFSLGFLQMRYGTADLTGLGGIAPKLPNLSAVFLIATLSLVGIPGLFGFPGLFATLGAVFGGEWTFAFLAIGSCLIGAWALFSMLQHLVFGSSRLPVPGEADVLIDRETPLVTTLDPGDQRQPSWSSDATPREWSIVADGKSGSIDLSPTELLILGPLLVSLVALGLWPQAISAGLRLALTGSSLSP
jgi:NADH:ubiquinone oxidoreductase subunit 4 (subunit M)